MTDERFTDQERRRLVALCLMAVPLNDSDPELTAIISRLSGVDTILYARRAYPSKDGGHHDR